LPVPRSGVACAWLTPRSKKKVRDRVNEKGVMYLRDCKEVFGFSRTIGLAVLEYLDRVGFTSTRGEENGRVLR